MIQYIVNAFEGVDTVSSSGDTFFFYDPRSELPVDHRFPFATLVTGDHYDTASNLGRLSVFRLNIGVSAVSYRSLFGGEEIHRGSTAPPEKRIDFADLDRLMTGELVSSPRVRNPKIPKAVSDVILKAMAPEITARYQRAGELLDDLLAARAAPVRRASRAAATATAEVPVDMLHRIKAREQPQARLCWHCNKPLHARSTRCPFCGENQ